jgi:hypothetical protein
MKSRSTRIYNSTLAGLGKLRKARRQMQIVIMDELVIEALKKEGIKS